MIKNKKEWYKLFNTVEFNKTYSFSITDFMKEHKRFPDDKIFCFRNPVIAGAPFLCMRKTECVKKITSGEFGEPYIVSEKAPDEHIIVQGEYDGFCAEVTFVKDAMRFALKEQRIHLSRLQFRTLVGDDFYFYLNELHDKYSTTLDMKYRPVIEFSLYSQPVGMYQKNYIIWEIRNY